MAKYPYLLFAYQRFNEEGGINDFQYGGQSIEDCQRMFQVGAERISHYTVDNRGQIVDGETLELLYCGWNENGNITWKPHDRNDCEC